MPPWDQFFMWLGLVIGVVFQPVVDQLRAGRVELTGPTVVTVAVAGVIALAIAPLVYRKSGVDSDSPFIVRFGLFIQNGLFWQVLVGAAGKLSGQG